MQKLHTVLQRSRCNIQFRLSYKIRSLNFKCLAIVFFLIYILYNIIIILISVVDRELESVCVCVRVRV